MWGSGINQYFHMYEPAPANCCFVAVVNESISPFGTEFLVHFFFSGRLPDQVTAFFLNDIHPSHNIYSATGFMSSPMCEATYWSQQLFALLQVL